MRPRMVMKAGVTISVIMTVILVLLQKRYPDNQLTMWFTSSDKNSSESKRYTTSISKGGRYEWLFTKSPARNKETIQPSQGYMLEMTSWHTNIHTDSPQVPKRKAHRDTELTNMNALKQKRTNNRRAYANQNVHRMGMITHQSGAKERSTTPVTTEQSKKLSKNCPKWEYKREDWTIVYHTSRAEYNVTSCPRQWIGKNIKRISFDDHTFLNTGCNKNTRECKEYPFYDFKKNVRINTPPCCRHHILTILDHVTTELKNQRVSHSMISGGVIGWVRNKGMIPYDRDLDLIVQIEYWNSTEFWRTFQRLHEQHGYVVDNVEEFKVKLYLSKINGNNIDIWAYWADNKTVSIAFHGFKQQPVETMLPFKAVKFEWFHTFVPAKPIEYLDRQYGKEVWRPEKHCMVRNAEGDCW